MDRRDFTQLLPALFAASALLPAELGAQQTSAPGTMDHPVMGDPTPGPATGNKPRGDVTLARIASGVYTPGGGYGSLPKRISHRYVLGMLEAGNIQLEIHETIQEPGATRRMVAGDIGLVNAGDYHYIRNAGDGQCTYFVVTLGPHEVYK